MKEIRAWFVAAGALLTFFPSPLHGGIVGLFEYGFNINGAITANAAPVGVNLGLFDTTTGLGTITIQLATPGPHIAGVFFDHEIDEATNTFFNEFGAVGGTAPSNLSWEIDEPGFTTGNIFTHFSASTAAASALDNSVGVPITAPNDVSLAAAYRFTLAPDERAQVTYILSTTAPSAGVFHLRHTDPASATSVYLTTGFTVTGGVIPEPVSAGWGLGCLGVLGLGRWRTRRGPKA